MQDTPCASQPIGLDSGITLPEPRIVKLPRMLQFVLLRSAVPDVTLHAEVRTLRTGDEVVKGIEARWLVCIAISIALHIAVLIRTPVAPFWPGGVVSSGPDIDVRLVTARPPAEVATAEQNIASQNVPAAETPEPPHSEIPRSESTRAPMAVPVPLESDDAQYASPETLSVRPMPMGEINVPYPDDTGDRGISKTSLTLFIDEDGTVVRVRIDDSELPPQFQEAAKNAFAKARFHPGQMGDRPVKSRMRVEVTFESRAPR
jgi:Gram-negative bacterial TonB protein C-terminal